MTGSESSVQLVADLHLGLCYYSDCNLELIIQTMDLQLHQYSSEVLCSLRLKSCHMIHVLVLWVLWFLCRKLKPSVEVLDSTDLEAFG